MNISGKNPVHPKKILDSKWTALQPENGEKHFIVRRCTYSAPGKMDQVELEAVLTGNGYWMAWRDLKDAGVWRMGWH